MTVEQRVVPLDRVGCYVPGGRYPLPSSLLMTAIPAAAAGVRDVIAVCPRPEPVVMAAALEAGVSRLFRVGGAHAIAALAYGTETVPRVDKIVGPGNRYVAAAKALVAADCGIDFYAGPTEIVIVAARGPAAWIAADLIAQAEHDPDARAVLITPSRTLAARVASAGRGAACPATAPRAQSLRAHGGIIVTALDSRGDRAGQRGGARAPRRGRRHAWRRRCAAPARCSSARGRRRWPATTPSARTTCCRPPAPRACAAGCPAPTSSGRSPCSA